MLCRLYFDNKLLKILIVLKGNFFQKIFVIYLKQNFKNMVERFPEMTDEIREMQTFKNLYARYHPNKSGVLFTRTVHKTEECGFPRSGLYFRTDGLIINYNIKISEEEKELFENDIVEVAKKYANVQQVAKRGNLPIVVPEHIREHNILKHLNYIYNPVKIKKVRKEAHVKQKIVKESLLYNFAKNTSRSVQTMFGNLHQGIYGEYRKNVDGEVIVNFIDTRMKYDSKQYKVAPESLYDFLLKYDLITLVEDRETYKKFYFTEKAFDAETLKKHFQVRGKRPKKVIVEK